jgi:hypothetical protein
MKILSIVFVLLGFTALAAGQDTTGRYEKVMSRLVKAINESNYTAIRQDFAPAMIVFRRKNVKSFSLGF